jgi:lactoylglutathione lyase
MVMPILKSLQRRTLIIRGCVFGDGVVDHLAIRVSDVESAKSYLEAKGVIFETEISFDEKLYDKGERFAMFRGPSGERLQIEQIL